MPTELGHKMGHVPTSVGDWGVCVCVSGERRDRRTIGNGANLTSCVDVPFSLACRINMFRVVLITSFCFTVVFLEIGLRQLIGRFMAAIVNLEDWSEIWRVGRYALFG